MNKDTILRAASIMALVPLLTACRVDPPENDLVSEEYTQNFIRHFGLLDYENDWNLSEHATLVIDPQRPVGTIDVYAHIGGTYYRLMSKSQLQEAKKFVFDVPEMVEQLVVVADGVRYDVPKGSRLTVGDEHQPSSRAGDDDPLGDGEVSSTMPWLIVAEDLGDTDDFDFNDVIIRLETNQAYTELAVEEMPWYDEDDIEVEDPEEVEHKAAPKSRASSSEVMKITALAAGGTVPVYLHYNDGTNDYVLTPAGAILTDDIPLGEELNYEWHTWFGAGNYPSTTMINTGAGATGRGKSIELPMSLLGEHFTFVDYSLVDSNGRILGFYITVDSPRYGLTPTDPARPVAASKPGAAPQMFLIPDIGATNAGWEWPRERRDILTCYSSFKDWVGDRTKTDWHTKKNANAECWPR